MKTIQIKQLSESATLPTRAYEHDAVTTVIPGVRCVTGRNGRKLYITD